MEKQSELAVTNICEAKHHRQTTEKNCSCVNYGTRRKENILILQFLYKDRFNLLGPCVQLCGHHIFGCLDHIIIIIIIIIHFWCISEMFHVSCHV